MSLRDVERAMIVFEYFCEKIEYFRKADQKLAVPSQEDDVGGNLYLFFCFLDC